MMTTIIVLALVLVGGGLYFKACHSAYRDQEPLNRLDKFC